MNESNVFSIFHCGACIMPKNEALELVDSNKVLKEKVMNSQSDKILILQGNTVIAGYLLVIQYLTKKYKNLEVLAVSQNMSFYGI